MTFSSALTSTPVVLLPGMMCDDRLFAFQTEQLRKDSQNAVKLYIPQLVYGSSMPELAQYLLAALPSSFCLCGLSMGGILAMEIVAQAPPQGRTFSPDGHQSSSRNERRGGSAQQAN